MKRERGELRSMAQEAKLRLKNGFWQAERQRREQLLAVSGGDRGYVLSNYINSLKNQLSGRQSDEFCTRVLELLEMGVSNPLIYMLDRKFMETLSEHDKERYILDMSKRVQEQIMNLRQHRTSRESKIQEVVGMPKLNA